jgi:hypothetical protein
LFTYCSPNQSHLRTPYIKTKIRALGQFDLLLLIEIPIEIDKQSCLVVAVIVTNKPANLAHIWAYPCVANRAIKAVA